ncbi:MAG: MFS transporter [Myxococcota bacterium]
MAEPLPAPCEPSAAPVQRHAYRWFVAGVGFWFLAWGMQQVLFSWLVVGELRLAPTRVGLAQTFLSLPSLLGLLFGGVVADRQDRRMILIVIYAVCVAVVAGMSAVVQSGHLTFQAVLIFATTMGIAQAFHTPAQEALLGDVAGKDLMRSVTGRGLVQFSALAMGSLLGGGAGWIGTGSALGVQAGILACGLVPLFRLRVEAQLHAPSGETPLADIRAGLREVVSSRELRALTLLVMGVGLFFIGPFFVVFPLLVRDVYQAGVEVLSLLAMMFPLGAIGGSAVLLLIGGAAARGWALLAALMGGSACLATVALHVPLPAFLALVFLWGVCGSVFLNTSRTLFQLAAPASHRGRMFSIYALGFMGMAPVGASVSGLLAARVGGLATCAMSAFAMVVLVAIVGSRARVAAMR